MLSALLLMLCGLIAAASIIVSFNPNAKSFVDKLTPIQGWVGIITVGLGTLLLIFSFIRLSWFANPWFGALAISIWFPYFLSAIFMIGLGFILGWGLFAKMALKNKPDLVEKTEALLNKLRAVQVPLGVTAIFLGLIKLINSFVWFELF